MAQIPFNKVRQSFQTGQSSGPVDRHSIESNPDPVPFYAAPSHILPRHAEDALDVVFTPRYPVLILTPFMSEYPSLVNKMNRYANLAVRDSIKRHEAPISSTLFYYNVLNVRVSIEKDIGLQSMLSWVPSCRILAIYVDYGITPAMSLTIKVGKMKGVHLEFRNISLT